MSAGHLVDVGGAVVVAEVTTVLESPCGVQEHVGDWRGDLAVAPDATPFLGELEKPENLG
jgi:hypothetical protein